MTGTDNGIVYAVRLRDLNIPRNTFIIRNWDWYVRALIAQENNHTFKLELSN